MNAIDCEANHDVDHDNIEDEKDENEDDMNGSVDVDRSAKMTWIKIDPSRGEWKKFDKSVQRWWKYISICIIWWKYCMKTKWKPKQDCYEDDDELEDFSENIGEHFNVEACLRNIMEKRRDL